MDLTEGSFYRPIAKQISDRTNGKDAENYLGSSAVFAERFVGDLLKGASGKVYRERLSTVLGILKSYFPEWIMVSFFRLDRMQIASRQSRNGIVSLYTEQA